MAGDAGRRTLCGKCGAVLDERSDLAVKERRPCPSCGALVRRFEVRLEGSVGLHSSLGLKARHVGERRPFLEHFSGAEFSRRWHRWMDKLRRIDRGGDWYDERVTDPETREVIHETHERLSEHRGHGSARPLADGAARAAGLARGVVDRPHISTWLLWSAEHHAALARQIEKARPKDQRYPWIEHRAYVVSSIIASASFLEAVVNELFQDVEDRGNGLLTPADASWSFTAPIPENVQREMRAYWNKTGGGWQPPLEKYKRLVRLAGRPGLNPTTRADADLLLDVRHALIHFRPRDHFTAQETSQLASRIQALKLEENPLVGAAPRAFWPEHALGSGLAEWGAHAAVSLADEACRPLGIEHDYAVQKRRSWPRFALGPGESELFGSTEASADEEQS